MKPVQRPPAGIAHQGGGPSNTQRLSQSNRNVSAFDVQPSPNRVPYSVKEPCAQGTVSRASIDFKDDLSASSTPFASTKVLQLAAHLQRFAAAIVVRSSLVARTDARGHHNHQCDRKKSPPDAHGKTVWSILAPKTPSNSLRHTQRPRRRITKTARESPRRPCAAAGSCAPVYLPAGGKSMPTTGLRPNIPRSRAAGVVYSAGEGCRERWSTWPRKATMGAATMPSCHDQCHFIGCVLSSTHRVMGCRVDKEHKTSLHPGRLSVTFLCGLSSAYLRPFLTICKAGEPHCDQALEGS